MSFKRPQTKYLEFSFKISKNLSKIQLQGKLHRAIVLILDTLNIFFHSKYVYFYFYLEKKNGED